MAIPNAHTLRREILELLASIPDGRMLAVNVYDILAERHPELTYEELEKYRNSRSHWANRVQWAKQHLVERDLVYPAGAGPNPKRAVWIITDFGREFLKRR